MLNNMRKIVRTSFPHAIRVIDRFHLQKMVCDTLQEMRIAHCWDTIQEETDAMEEAKWKGMPYSSILFANGDTIFQIIR